MNTGDYKLAVDKLRAVLATKDRDPALANIIDVRDAVLARYGPIFSLTEISNLTEEQFRSFLQFENNNHWTGLNRKGHLACRDMPVLRAALSQLLDEERPLPDRMNTAADGLQGMGKALITAILLVAFPDRYGVWNGTSEAALKALKVWPKFERGSTFGDRYVSVNKLLLQLAKDLGTDLWTLDVLHWRAVPEDDPPGLKPIPPGGGPTTEEAQRFGLERHLHEFLRDNWERTPLGKDWSIYAEQGEPEAGYEYSTEIGRIDLLAKHRKKPWWLVIELKRSQSSDDTVGQTLRYMAWVRRHLAEKGEDVEGLIIAHEADERLRYAISETPKIKLNLYEVSFSLRPDSGSITGNGTC